MDRVPAGGQSQEDELMTSDLQRRLRPLIASLPKKLRDVLLLAGSGDHSYDEIGTMLKMKMERKAPRTRTTTMLKLLTLTMTKERIVTRKR